MANKRLNAVITIGGTVTGALKSALGDTRSRLRGIGDTIRDLEREQRKLQNTLKSPGDLAGPVYHLEHRYDALTRKIEKARRTQDKMNRAVRGMDKARAGIGSAMAGLATVGAVAATGIVPVVQAASFESAMTGVGKQVDGARDANGNLTATYYEMRKQIQLLGREIPIATNELAGMVEAGARMGIARENLIDFTRTTAMMATALDLPREELSDQMGKIANLFHLPIPAVAGLGDAINYLDDNSVSKAGDIIEFLSRTGGVAGAVSVTGKEMAALGSTLLSLGERTETAGTASNAFIQKLAAATKGTKKFRAAMEEMGVSAEVVQKGMQVDAQGTILKVLDAVQAMPKDQRLGILVDMVGLEHSDTIAKLAGNVEKYRKQIAMVNSQKAEGSVSREFSAQLATTNAQWDIFKNKLTEVSVNIGSALLPSVNKLMGGIGDVIGVMADWGREHPVLVKNIGLVIGSVLAGVGAFKTLKLALAAVPFALNAVRLAMATNPIGLAFVAISTAAVLIYENWKPISAFFKGIWADVRGATEKTWTWLKDAFFKWAPLGIVIKNWGPLTKWFSGLFDDIMGTARRAIDWVLGKIAAVGRAWKSVKGFFGAGGDEKPAGRGAPPRGPTPPPAPAMATARGGSRSFTDNSKHTWHITGGNDPKATADEIDRRWGERRKGRAGSILYDEPRGY
ncbi:hypothetical protein GCM10011349_11830 [Novosphingobium indicum]|uniref:Phage tail tape measure protein domain-containing protein n=1 Tax=Novosphingobium indicum TaxID=462949 RepID=A0ABQ2JGQ2_9SPHN|nr:phage tail tape measure protein [Novosphingobium indicum]GGN45583.1 hypothetical protein GCM10011349_11830 [Novosphingobium indicum]